MTARFVDDDIGAPDPPELIRRFQELRIQNRNLADALSRIQSENVQRQEKEKKDRIQRRNILKSIFGPIQNYLQIIQNGSIDQKTRALLLIDKMMFAISIGNSAIHGFLHQDDDEIQPDEVQQQRELEKIVEEFETEVLNEIQNVYVVLTKI